jgi:hypothetical protein
MQFKHVCPTTDVLPTLGSCLTLILGNATNLKLISDMPVDGVISPFFSTSEICVICALNFHLEQAMNYQQGSRSVALLFLYPRF